MVGSKIRFCLLTAIIASIIRPASGHGAMIYPPTRNAIDGTLPKFQNGKFEGAFYGCNCGASSGKGCSPGTRTPMDGQPCLWFQQGCTIGCKDCNNATQHTMGQKLCKEGIEPTLPREAWTMNRWVTAGSVNDTYRYHPWRAPGHAPVVDACGIAGGHPPGGSGAGAGVFEKTKYAQLGDIGSQVLKPRPMNTTWKAGSSIEVKWGIRANHGGGYYYRLCPANKKPTEECFQAMPLEFDTDKMQQIEYTNGTRAPKFKGTYVTTGTYPPGSMWAMNPVPRIDFDSIGSGQPPGWKGCVPGARKFDTPFPTTIQCRQFDPTACKEGSGPHPWHPIEGKQFPTGDVEGSCSGDFIAGAIVDYIKIPANIPSGDYVVGWRWDCEETAQIWSNCADVTITA